MKVLIWIWIGLVAVIHASPLAEETEFVASANEESEEKIPPTILVPELKKDSNDFHKRSSASTDQGEMNSLAGMTLSSNRLPLETLWNTLLSDLNKISSTNPSFNATNFVNQLSDLITILAASAANTQVQQVLSTWVQNVAELFNPSIHFRPNQPSASITVIDVTDKNNPLLVSKTSHDYSLKEIFEGPYSNQYQEDNSYFHQQHPYMFIQRRPYYPAQYQGVQHPYYYGYQQQYSSTPYSYSYPHLNYLQYQENHDAEQNLAGHYFQQVTPYSVNPTISGRGLSDLEALAQLEQLLRNEESKRSLMSSNPRSNDGELEVEGRGLISSITTGAQAVRTNVKSIIKSIHSNLPTVTYKTLLVPSFGSTNTN